MFQQRQDLSHAHPGKVAKGKKMKLLNSISELNSNTDVPKIWKSVCKVSADMTLWKRPLTNFDWCISTRKTKGRNLLPWSVMISTTTFRELSLSPHILMTGWINGKHPHKGEKVHPAASRINKVPEQTMRPLTLSSAWALNTWTLNSLHHADRVLPPACIRGTMPKHYWTNAASTK